MEGYDHLARCYDHAQAGYERTSGEYDHTCRCNDHAREFNDHPAKKYRVSPGIMASRAFAHALNCQTPRKLVMV